MSSTQSVIQFGLKLLKKGRLEANELASYSEAFSILGIDTTASLKLAALASVFSARDDQKAKYYKPSALNPEEINYPCNNAPVDDIPGFGEAVGTDSNALTVLEKFGTFVSVASIPSPDSVDSVDHSQTPVYDLFKTAAAIDDCLKTGESDEKFLLVGCDFSGIQDTVYTITSKGALKTLRARSFMLELLTEHIIHEILTTVNAGRHAIIYSGGGGFGLLLPNNAKTICTINKYRIKLNDWAVEEFSARFFIAIDVLSLSAQQLKEDFQKLRQQQADNLDRLKRTKFVDQLPKLFELSMPEQVTVRTECQITRRDDLDAKKMFDLHTGTRMDDDSVKDPEDNKWTWVSESCFHQFNLGDRLINANVVNRYAVPVNRAEKKNYGTLILPGTNGNAFYKVNKEHDTATEFYWRINSWDGGRVFQYSNYVRKHEELSSYARQKEMESLNEELKKGEHRNPQPEDTATFQGLASSSCGADMIGALRMDVDGMGNVFSVIDNPIELSVKSRMLNLFFKVYLHEICKAQSTSGVEVTDIVRKDYKIENAYGMPGRNVSVIYAGGDDLFIVGAWDETSELAFDIQRCFAHFTGGIFDIAKQTVMGGCGISGGLTLHQPKFPLYQMARISGEAESVAKHDRDTIYNDATKNRIALFYDNAKYQRKEKMQNADYYMLSMTWNLSHEFLLPLMKAYQACGNLIQQDGRTTFEIEKFSYQTIEKWFAVIEKYQESYKFYLPTMARVMKRVEEDLGEEHAKIFKKLLSFLYTNDKSKENWISHLHIALNWLSYLRRTK